MMPFRVSAQTAWLTLADPLQLLARELRFIDPVSRIEHHFRSQLPLQW